MSRFLCASFVFLLLLPHFNLADNTATTDDYILVFKQGVTRSDITNHIQLMYQQVDEHANTSSSSSSSSLLNSKMSSIGEFHWYSGSFASQSFETLFASSQHLGDSSTASSHSDILHYWVKDTTLTLQEMVQKDPPSWGLDRIDQRQGFDGLYKFQSKQGQGVTVYILDSGVMADHEDLKGRVTIGKTIVGDDDNDNDGHGTFVAGVCCGTTYGVAKAASVVSVKILDSDGNGRLSDLLKGLEWVVEQHNFASTPTVAPSSLPTTLIGQSTGPMPSVTTISVNAGTAIIDKDHKAYPLSNKTVKTKPSPKSKSTRTTCHRRQSSVHHVSRHASIHKRKLESQSTTVTHISSPAATTLSLNTSSSASSSPASFPSPLQSPLPLSLLSSSLPSSPASSQILTASVSSEQPSIAYSPANQGRTKSIVNLSLGALYNQVANDAVQQVIQLGIHVVVAAGNYGEDSCLYSPSSAQGVVTVGALDRDDSIAYYSNFGQCVDIFAPGTNINSITSDTTSATDTLTGTSMAAPHVTGSMALFLAQNDYSPSELSNYLKSMSSLVYLDFAINNTDGNTNKSVLDNAVNMGNPVQHESGHQFNTPVNILFTQPDDGQPLWIFGGQVTNDSASSFSLSSAILLLMVAVIPIFYL